MKNIKNTNNLAKAKRILKNEGYKLKFNGQMWEISHKNVSGSSLVSYDKLVNMSKIYTDKFR